MSMQIWNYILCIFTCCVFLFETNPCLSAVFHKLYKKQCTLNGNYYIIRSTQVILIVFLFYYIHIFIYCFILSANRIQLHFNVQELLSFSLLQNFLPPKTPMHVNVEFTSNSLLEHKSQHLNNILIFFYDIRNIEGEFYYLR